MWTDLSPPYGTIVVDPPWHYDGYATMPGNSNKRGHITKRPPLPYSTLSCDEIRNLAVADLAARDAVLYLWTTNRYLPDAFSVITTWGFSYRQCIVWHKIGNPSPFGGTVGPNHAEFLLVAVKGSPSIVRNWPGSVIAVQKPYEHSTKPEWFLDLIEASSPAPRVELFSRRSRFGWDVWGFGYE